MALLRPFRSSLDAVGRNPAIVVVAGLLTLAQLPQFAARALGPTASTAVSTAFSLLYLVGIPYVNGGLFGMADEALDGRTRLATFHASGTAHYVPMFVATLLVVAANFVVFGGLLLVVGLGFVFALAADPGTAALVAVGAVVAILLAYVAVYALVQFYGQAIVLEDLGGVDGLRRSISTVRSDLRAVAAYTLAVGLVVTPLALVVGAASLLVTPQPIPGLSLPEVPPPVAVVGGGVLFVASTLVTAVFVTFSVAFYRDLRAGDATGSDEAGGTTRRSA